MWWPSVPTVAIRASSTRLPRPAGYPSHPTRVSTAPTLEDIVQQVLGCGVEIGQTPAHPELVEIMVDGTPYPRVQDCDGEDGWIYGDTFETLVLCNQACTDFEGSGIIDIHLVCP